MGRSAERGSLLLAVRVRSILNTLLSWGFLALMVAITAAQYWKTGKFYAGGLPAGLVVLVYAIHPRIKFFEGGVEIPPNGDQKIRFLTWQQVERYSWDGGTLVLTGTSSILSGGPAEGGTADIPDGQREAVEQILAANVRPM